MNSDWSRAAHLLRSSQPSLATELFEKALNDANPGTTQPLLRQILKANLLAARNASAGSRHMINANVPLVPTPSSSANPQLFFYTHEIILINAYNRALFLLKRLPAKSVESIIPIARKLKDAIARIAPTLERFLQQARISIPLADDICIQICDLTQSILTHEVVIFSSITNEHEKVYIFQWCRACANALDLFSATQMMMHTTLKAVNASSAAASMRTLCDALQASLSSSTANEQSSRSHGNGKEQGKVDPHNMVSKTDDACRTRTMYLKALALASDGDFQSARVALAATTEAHCSADDAIQNPMSYPVVYMSALLPLLGQGRLSKQEKIDVVKYAEWCVSKSYRIADALALAARASPSIHRWRLATGASKVDDRCAALYMSSRSLGRVGLYDKQLELLEHAQSVLTHMLSSEREEDTLTIGHVRLGKQLKLDEEDQDDGLPRHSLAVADIKAERIRVLYTLGRVDDAEELESKMESAQFEKAHEWNLEKAIGRAMNGMNVNLEFNSISSWWRRVAHALACTESGLRRGVITDAVKAMNEAQRQCVKIGNANLSLCEQMVRACVYYNTGVVLVCRGPDEVARADESFAAAQTAFDKCRSKPPSKENNGDDEDGYETGLYDEINELSMMATVGRCLALWGQGRKDDAVVHWVDKRGLKARAQSSKVEKGPADRPAPNDIEITTDEENERKYKTLVCSVEEDVVQLMDEQFVAVYKRINSNSLNRRRRT